MDRVAADQAMCDAHAAYPEAEWADYSIVPRPEDGERAAYHKWLIAFSHLPRDVKSFALALDNSLKKQQHRYLQARMAGRLTCLRITCLQKEAFINFLRHSGRPLMQPKVRHIYDDAKITESLYKHKHSDV